ncbi:hypothetical protein [Streptococcus pluranimalium]|uniref:hypothetical protein n=1 Tax=Streptococcus pluranimalium TaxID=82348 RepID=UPI003F66F11D
MAFINDDLKKLVSEDCIYFKKNGILDIVRKPTSGSIVIKFGNGKTLGYEVLEKHY